MSASRARHARHRCGHVSTNGLPCVLAPQEEHFSTCAKTIGDIRDQSNCGCCWAFAGAEAASDRMCIATKGKMMMPLSSQDVCFNSNFNGCDGGQVGERDHWAQLDRIAHARFHPQ